MEDNVKGLIRTCCIVLVISVGLSVVYSAKRPYIYLIENYDHYYTPPPPEHPQPNAATRAIRTRSRHDHRGASGNNYNNRFYYPFLFQDIHRHGEVTADSHGQDSFEVPEPLISPPTVISRNSDLSRRRNSDGGKSKNVKKKADKKERNDDGVSPSFTATTASPSEETLSFPLPWEWNGRMENVKTTKKKDGEKKQADENTEDRKFRLPRLPTLPPFPSIDFQFETLEPGRMSRSHNPNRSQSTSSKQIQFSDIISPETLSFISKLQMLNVTKLAANAGGTGIISLNAGGSAGGSDELSLSNPSVGTPLLSGDFLNLESTKPLIIPKDTASSRPSAAEIEAYHKLKNQFNKPAKSNTNRDSDEDDEQEEVEDDEAEDDTSTGDIEGSQQQSDEDQEIGSKSKESKEDEQEQDQEREPEQDQEQEQADSKEEEPEHDQGGSNEEEQGNSKDEDQGGSKEENQGGSKEEEQDQEPVGSKEEQAQSDEEALDPSDEEIANDSPATRTKKKTKRPSKPVRRPSDTYALTSLPQSLQSYSYSRPKPNLTSHSQYQQDNLFESANVQPESSEQSAKPVIILVNVPKPNGLKGDIGDHAYGEEEDEDWPDKKAEKKKKKAEKKKKFEEKKKKKKAKKKKKKESKKKKKAWPKKKKEKKKGWPPKKKKKKGWGPPTTMRPNKKADIINRLTKVHSNVQEIFQTFKGVISDYVINRPHIGVEFIHTNRNQPPPHQRPPPPKAEDNDDDDDEEDWKKEKSGEDEDWKKEKSGEDEDWKKEKSGEEKSGEMDGDDHEHDREKSDDRKLRLPGNSASYEDFVDDNQYVAVRGKPTLWNPTEWSYSYSPPGADADTENAAASLSKRLQDCQKKGRLADCASYVVDRPVKYKPPEPIYVESVVSRESGEKPPRPPYREPPPRISTGSSEKVWVKTWDKEHTGLPLPIDSKELSKSG